MNPLDRRQFVHAALAAGLAGRAKEPSFPIVDTHQHLWDLKKFRLKWLAKGSALDRNFLPADYAAASKGLGIVQAVYLEVDVDPAQQQAEADAVVALCKKGDSVTRAAVISGRPAADGFAKYIRPFKGSAHVKGLRQVLHGPSTPAGYCLDRKFVAGIRLLGELGLHFELCMRHAELPDAVKLVDACPGTRFVLDHCGNPDLVRHEKWKKDLAELARRKNVVVKVSGIVASARPGKWKADDLAPVVKHTLSTFGPDRVMFGGDWPVCLLAATLAQWVGALKQIVADRPAEQQRKLFHDNAVRFYGLKTT
jgi:predicted TIM-barrel fold metal-dependent hydrolase